MPTLAELELFPYVDESTSDGDDEAEITSNFLAEENNSEVIVINSGDEQENSPAPPLASPNNKRSTTRKRPRNCANDDSMRDFKQGGIGKAVKRKGRSTLDEKKGVPESSEPWSCLVCTFKHEVTA